MTNLADRYFTIKNEIDALTRLLDETKAAIKATGRDEIVGELALVTVGLSERVALDQKLVKGLLTPALQDHADRDHPRQVHRQD